MRPPALVEFCDALANLVRGALGLPRLAPVPAVRITGGEIMYIVKDDNPDVRYALNPVVVKDAEGNVITPAPPVTILVESSNPDAVAVAPDADPIGGTVHFGNPGTASLTATFALASDGTIKAVHDAQFVVTTGDPASISGGEITIEGLTEA